MKASGKFIGIMFCMAGLVLLTAGTVFDSVTGTFNGDGSGLTGVGGGSSLWATNSGAGGIDYPANGAAHFGEDGSFKITSGSDVNFSVSDQGDVHCGPINGHHFIDVDGLAGIPDGLDINGATQIQPDGSATFGAKVTATGGVDPPYVLYDRHTEAEFLQQYANEVPVNKQSGLALWYDGTNLNGYVGSTGKKFLIGMTASGTASMPAAQPRPAVKAGTKAGTKAGAKAGAKKP